MDILILDFLEAYKNLDELCKQILSNESGISQYIIEMECEEQEHKGVPGWDNDYKQLKRMKKIRNKLVHDTDSFEQQLFSEEDIEWLKSFRSRILQLTHPFALLDQLKMNSAKTTGRKEIHSKTEVRQEVHTNITPPTNRKSRRVKIVVGCVLLAAIMLTIILFLKYT